MSKQLSTKKLSSLIKEKRTAYNLTQEELGEKTGIHRIMISKMENGNYIPSFPQFNKIAETLNVNIEDVIETRDNGKDFVALRSEALSAKEKTGFDQLLKMMRVLKQQIILRRQYDKKR